MHKGGIHERDVILNYQAGDSRRRLRSFLRSNCRITIACEPVLCDAHLELHKNNVVAQIVRRCFGWGTAIDNHDGKLAPFYFRPLYHSFRLCAFCRQSAPQLFVHRNTAPCLGGMGSKDGCTLPNALHGDVRRGLAAQQPTPHPILSRRVWNFFSGSAFLAQLFCLSASRPTPHSCTA